MKHRRFFYLWLGQLISVAGTQMQIWAIFWHIRILTDQPIAISGVGLVRILPVIFFSLISGAVADSYNRRTIIFITQSSAAVLALILGLLTLWGYITLWYIYLLTALQAVVVAFDGPARAALIPNLVPTEDLANAFSLNSIASDAGSVIGPAVSGFVIAASGQASVYLINAISYVAVIVALILIGDIPQKMQPHINGVSWSSIREGIGFIISKPIIFSSMILDFIATFFASANTLMPFVANDVLHVNVVAYGWLSAAQSVGAMTAAVIISQVHQLRKQGPLFLSAVFIFGLATVVFGAAASFAVAWTALAVTGAADGVSTIIRNTIRQLQTPDEMRGRMTSVNQIFFQGGPQLGELEAGAAAQLFGTPFAIISGGIGCIIGLGFIIAKWPRIWRYDGDEPMMAGATAD
ncbi:MAG TPA: MFS transporter [Anaerolineales bacterium]|nr:MFS transporter [Anaerolineales bacterium]